MRVCACWLHYCTQLLPLLSSASSLLLVVVLLLLVVVAAAAVVVAAVVAVVVLGVHVDPSPAVKKRPQEECPACPGCVCSRKTKV